MFLFQHPEEYLRSAEAERERVERQRRVLRELRGAAPPFSEAQTRRLSASLAETRPGSYAGVERRRAVPCPEVKEPMTS